MKALPNVSEDPLIETEDVVVLLPQREHLGERLDRYVADALQDLSRTTVQSLIESGHILVDGIQRKPKFHITPGEVITVELAPPVQVELQPEPIPLSVVYEDDDLIVIDKPAGLVVHPAPGHPTGTLANALIAHAPEINIAGTNRPGIVHRLDKDTSGLIVAAKSDRGRTSLVSQWESRRVKKNYVALASGSIVEDEATIDAPIGRDPKNRQRMAVVSGGRPAVTRFRVSERFAAATLLDVEIETGRTHQIRVHLAFIGHPVIGDRIYGKKDPAGIAVDRQFLHASGLEFQLPDGREVAFSLPLPADLQAVLDAYRAGEPR
jgi:23S rRNA pseudouridine1911/1915/1917 synthase